MSPIKTSAIRAAINSSDPINSFNALPWKEALFDDPSGWTFPSSFKFIVDDDTRLDVTAPDADWLTYLNWMKKNASKLSITPGSSYFHANKFYGKLKDNYDEVHKAALEAMAPKLEAEAAPAAPEEAKKLETLDDIKSVSDLNEFNFLPHVLLSHTANRDISFACKSDAIKATVENVDRIRALPGYADADILFLYKDSCDDAYWMVGNEAYFKRFGTKAYNMPYVAPVKAEPIVIEPAPVAETEPAKELSFRGFKVESKEELEDLKMAESCGCWMCQDDIEEFLEKAAKSSTEEKEKPMDITNSEITVDERAKPVASTELVPAVASGTLPAVPAPHAAFDDMGFISLRIGERSRYDFITRESEKYWTIEQDDGEDLDTHKSLAEAQKACEKGAEDYVDEMFDEGEDEAVNIAYGVFQLVGVIEAKSPKVERPKPELTSIFLTAGATSAANQNSATNNMIAA